MDSDTRSCHLTRLGEQHLFSPVSTSAFEEQDAEAILSALLHEPQHRAPFRPGSQLADPEHGPQEDGAAPWLRPFHDHGGRQRFPERRRMLFIEGPAAFLYNPFGG